MVGMHDPYYTVTKEQNQGDNAKVRMVRISDSPQNSRITKLGYYETQWGHYTCLT